ncbi:Trichodiene oxygenase [Beauveria bassiana]|nr:Trichodiene oxygenase [Beauveria bassiana]KAH8719097.1 Cytochrome P450 monooxygenase TRI4 [Beauveria bassiana]
MNRIMLHLVEFAQRAPQIAAAAAIFGGFVVYFIYTCFYNIYLHPLRHIPGSKWAVIGPYLEFYHEVIRDGQYLWEIEKMHQKFGPIIRVNAREIHIRDPEFYHTIYTAGSRKTNKDPDTVGAFDVPNATAGTVEHDHHRARRGYLNSYFAKRAIAALEPTVHERVSKAFTRIDEHLDENKILSLDGVFCALTADVISSRFYGKHQDYLSIPDFHFVVRDGFLGLTKVYHLARFLPIIVTTLKRLPYGCIRMVIPAVADLLVMRDEIKVKGADEFVASQTSESKSSVLVGALANPHIPPHERTVDRMLDEGTVVLFAGTETTSRTMCVTMFYLLTHPECLARLRAELETLPPSEDYKHSLPALENLPYLTAVIHEGLRLTFGPISRSSRVATEQELVYGEYTIPVGTPVSQSTYFMHSNESIFPDYKKFDPERFIKAAKEGVNLTKFVTNFSGGSRMCIGFNMSFAEMYLTLSRVVRQYDFELFDTTLADVDITHARIVGYPKAIPGKKEFLGEIRVKVCRKNIATF